MALNNFGGGGGSGGTALLQPHDATLSGGATWHWPLNNTAVEAVTGGSPYDVVGTLVFSPDGPSGEAGSLNCTESTGMVTGNIGEPAEIKTAITVAAWLYREGTPSGNLDLCSARIAGAGSANNTPWALGINSSNQIRSWHQQGGADAVEEGGATANTASALNTWEHWTWTRNAAGTNALFYKNGVLVETTSGLTAPDGGANVTTLVLGQNKSGGEIPGRIFSPIVFETEMNAGAVLALYNSTSSIGSW
jgi:hypothetical protein